MTKEESDELMAREIAITGFQQMVRAGVANSFAGVLVDYDDDELQTLVSLFSNEQDKEVLSLMRREVDSEIEVFKEIVDTEKSSMEDNPTLLFLNRVKAIVMEVEQY